MTRLARLLVFPLLLAFLLAPVANAAQLGAYGAIAGATTSGVAGKFTATFASAQIIFKDDGATAGTLDATESVYLDLSGNSQVDTSDLFLTGSAGSPAATSISSGLSATTGGTPVKNLLRFLDSLPSYAEGGPDTKFNPGETLFVDVDSSATLNLNDLLLTATGRQATTDGDGTWNALECIYQATAGAPTAVIAGLVRVSDGCTAGLSGSVVGGADADVSQPLVAISGIAITGGDASFAAGEDAYIGSTTLASGHMRTTAVGALAARSVADCVVSTGHAADADCTGTTLTTATSTYVSRTAVSYPAIAFPAVKWLDFDGDNQYGSTDRAYLDFGAATHVSPAAVRVSTGSSAAFGSRPALGDVDTRAALGAAVTTAKVLYQDGGTAGTVDATDAIALDLDGDIHFDFGDVPLTSDSLCTPGLARRGASTCGASSAGTWKDIATASPAGALMYHDEGTAGPTRGDGLYVHFGALTTTVQNDIRITQSIVSGTSYAGGARVPASGSDQGIALTATAFSSTPTTHTVARFDADASGTATPGDVAYLELGAGNLMAGPADARLHNQFSLTHGNFLSEAIATDRDALYSLTALGAVPTFAFFDTTGEGISSDDGVFLRLAGGACGAFASTDSRVSAGALSKAAGTTVGTAQEQGQSCTSLALGKFAFTSANTVFSSASVLYADLTGNSIINVGDVTLSGAGAKIASGSSVVNDPLTAITLGAALGTRTGLVAIRYLDVNGNGAFDGESLGGSEPLVLDIDGDAVYSSGDALLTGTGGTTSLAGVVTTNPPAATTTTTTTAASSTSSAASSTSTAASTSSSTGTSSSSTSTDPTTATLAAMNQALADSLTVKREGGANVLTWDDQDGEDGYNIFSADSPFVLLAYVNGNVTTYRDAEGSSSRSYVVTAVLHAVGVTADDVNNGDVPGYSGVPVGEAAPAGKKGFIPAPGLAFALLALGAAFVLVRRRL